MAIIAANTGILRGKEEAKDTPSKSFLFSIDSQTLSQNSLPECASVLNPAEPVYVLTSCEFHLHLCSKENFSPGTCLGVVCCKLNLEFAEHFSR
jgi:hypothetical protein